MMLADMCVVWRFDSFNDLIHMKQAKCRSWRELAKDGSNAHASSSGSRLFLMEHFARYLSSIMHVRSEHSGAVVAESDRSVQIQGGVPILDAIQWAMLWPSK